MNQFKWLIVFLVILALNNIALIKWMERSSAPASTGLVEARTLTQSTDGNDDRNSDAVKALPENSEVSEAQADNVEGTQSQIRSLEDDDRFIEAFTRASARSELSDIFLELQFSSQRRYLELEKRMDSMSSSELVGLISASSSLVEKEVALNKLREVGFAGVQIYELKDLYQSGDTQQWMKAQILSELISKNDADGIAWAKEMLSEGLHSSRYLNSEMLVDLYEKDRDYVTQYVENINVLDAGVPYTVSSLLQQEPKLATRFVSKNFDQLLDADHAELSQVGYFSAKFDMSEAQQDKLLAALESDNRYTRGFAIALVGNVDGTDRLRAAYRNLKSTREKRRFIFALSQDADKASLRALARELSATSKN